MKKFKEIIQDIKEDKNHKEIRKMLGKLTNLMEFKKKALY